MVKECLTFGLSPKQEHGLPQILGRGYVPGAIKVVLS